MAISETQCSRSPPPLLRVHPITIIWDNRLTFRWKRFYWISDTFLFWVFFEIWRIFYSWPIDRCIYHTKDRKKKKKFILFYFIKIIIVVVTLFICLLTDFHPPSFSFVNVCRIKMEENEWMNEWSIAYGSHRVWTLGMITFCAAIQLVVS